MYEIEDNLYEIVYSMLIGEVILIVSFNNKEKVISRKICYKSIKDVN